MRHRRSRASQAQLFERHVDAIHRFVTRMRGSDREMVEDLVQGTFLAAFSVGRRGFVAATRAPGSTGIAANHVRDYARRELRRKRALVAVADVVPTHTGGGDPSLVVHLPAANRGALARPAGRAGADRSRGRTRPRRRPGAGRPRGARYGAGSTWRARRSASRWEASHDVPLGRPARRGGLGRGPGGGRARGRLCVVHAALARELQTRALIQGAPDVALAAPRRIAMRAELLAACDCAATGAPSVAPPGASRVAGLAGGGGRGVVPRLRARRAPAHGAATTGACAAWLGRGVSSGCPLPSQGAPPAGAETSEVGRVDRRRVHGGPIRAYRRRRARHRGRAGAQHAGPARHRGRSRGPTGSRWPMPRSGSRFAAGQLLQVQVFAGAAELTPRGVTRIIATGEIWRALPEPPVAKPADPHTAAPLAKPADPRAAALLAKASRSALGGVAREAGPTPRSAGLLAKPADPRSAALVAKPADPRSAAPGREAGRSALGDVAR